MNQLLDSPNLMNFTYNGKTPTNREVMNTYIYGGLAHANPPLAQLYREWSSFPPTKAFLDVCFTTVLTHVLNAIAFIAHLNTEVLGVLSEE